MGKKLIKALRIKAKRKRIYMLSFILPIGKGSKNSQPNKPTTVALGIVVVCRSTLTLIFFTFKQVLIEV